MNGLGLVMQAKLRDAHHTNTEQIKQLNQDLKAAADILRSHKQDITNTIDKVTGQVAAVHAELVAA